MSWKYNYYSLDLWWFDRIISNLSKWWVYTSQSEKLIVRKSHDSLTTKAQTKQGWAIYHTFWGVSIQVPIPIKKNLLGTL